MKTGWTVTEALSGGGACYGDFCGLEALVTVLPLALGLVIAPVAAIVGAGIGVAGAHSEAEIERAHGTMTTALDAAQSAEAVRAGIVAAARERAGRQLYDCGALETEEACRQQSPDPVAVLLSIRVSPPYFEVEGSAAFDLRLLLSADAKVVRAQDAVTIYKRGWVYRGQQDDYFAFAADDAALFRAELERATNALAAKMVDDILVGGAEEVHSSDEQPEGSVWTVYPPASATGDARCS